MNSVLQTIAAILIAIVYLTLPLLTVWGWIRWMRGPHAHSLTSVLSLISFVFATASIVLAISSLIYAQVVRSFPFYDPLLLRIYRLGGSLSMLGIIFSLGGIWRPSTLRWHAPACSIGMLFFWFFSATGE
jgi:hypothetical protein